MQTNHTIIVDGRGKIVIPTFVDELIGEWCVMYWELSVGAMK